MTQQELRWLDQEDLGGRKADWGQNLGAPNTKLRDSEDSTQEAPLKEQQRNGTKVVIW